MQGVIYTLTRQVKNVPTYDVKAAKTGFKTRCKNNEIVWAELLRFGGGLFLVWDIKGRDKIIMQLLQFLRQFHRKVSCVDLFRDIC